MWKRWKCIQWHTALWKQAQSKQTGVTFLKLLVCRFINFQLPFQLLNQNVPDVFLTWRHFHAAASPVGRPILTRPTSRPPAETWAEVNEMGKTGGKNKEGTPVCVAHGVSAQGWDSSGSQGTSERTFHRDSVFLQAEVVLVVWQHHRGREQEDQWRRMQNHPNLLLFFKHGAPVTSSLIYEKE